jgi:hypothetical protein
MKAFRQLIAVMLMLSVGTAMAVDLHRKNVLYFLRHSAITAHVRIDAVSTDEKMGAENGGGYKRFKVSALVIESFKGTKPGEIEFYVTQEQPSEPPNSGNYIVSLNRENGRLVFADTSVLWVDANPKLLAAARRGK